MAKEKKELKPEIKEMQPLITIPENKENITPDEVFIPKNSENSDSFFRNLLNKLFDKKDISLKTEYLNVMENFTGSKLEFLSKYGNMPYLNEFVDIFETKRVSLKRKGRQEIIMALQQREQELQAEQQQRFKTMFGMK